MLDINFFKPYNSKKSSSRKKVLSSVLVIVFLLVILGGSQYVIINRTSALEKEVATMEDYIHSEKVTKALEEVNFYTNKLDIMNQYYNLVLNINRDIEGGDVINTDFMRQLSATLPEGLTLESLSMTSSSLDIQGTSQGRVSVAELEYNLKDMGRFSKVHVTSISEASGGIDTYSFTINCLLKDVENDEVN